VFVRPHFDAARYPDGAHHGCPAQYRADRSRGNRFLRHGTRLLHLDERHVRTERERAVEQISQVTGERISRMPDPALFAGDGPDHLW